ncbi:DUF2791 family P-loop domain-containing protein [bacterium]|nr:DUF2791 family P-loop domain-containing protein [candidate division CSSED10-310 bacterium]
MYIRPENWIQVIEEEYLKRFVLNGGSVVKFAVTLENVDPKAIRSSLQKSAVRNRYIFTFADAANCKIHMIEQLFFSLSHQIDWDGLAFSVLKRIIESKGYRFPDLETAGTSGDNRLSFESIARMNDRVTQEFQRDVSIWLEQEIYKRGDMALEFKIAMLRLCFLQMDRHTGGISEFVHDSVIEWLHGSLSRISELRSALIFRKIARNNARNMLLSLSPFVRLAGYSGVVIHLDIGRYLVTQRQEVPEGEFYYTKAAAMDLYEVLRQFIDGTDQQRNCLIVVTAPLGFIQNEKRGLSIYTALRDRTIEDVHDRTRANPMASLSRLAHCGEPLSMPDFKDGSDPDAVRYERAIEALRCGVPNEDAVRELETFQEHIREQFQLQLQKLKEQPQSQSPGMLVAGGFGGGKSHLLQSLQTSALQQNFACSRIVISKETPLFDPVKMFAAAVANLRLPGNQNGGLETIIHRLDPAGERFLAFERWLKMNRRDLSDRFAATLFFFTCAGSDVEFMDRIIRYWSGDKLLDSEIKRRLKQVGELQSYELTPLKAADLAMQRFRFIAQLMIAAGYDGWVLFIDEAELIGRYSLLQRSRSYGKMAQFLGRVSDWNFEGMTSVIAITDDFQSAVLDERNDIEKVPNRLLARGTESDLYLARIAEHCMRIIRQDRIVLRSPDSEIIDATFNRLRDIYGAAYRFQPGEIGRGELLSSSRIRHFVKGWITEWDLKRFDPGYRPDIQTEVVSTDYTQDSDLEKPLGEVEDG